MKEVQVGEIGACLKTSCQYAGVGKVAISLLAAFFITGSLARAADAALDDASSEVYTEVINYEGLNGGAGFGPWQNTPAENSELNGLFIGDSNSNGDAGGPGINSDGDVAFGLYANSGEVALAIRSFSGGLVIGQSFYVDFDNGTLEGDDSLQGFSLQDANGEPRLEFFVRTGAGSYLISDDESEFSTEMPVTSGGLSIAVTITSEDTYDISITDLASGNSTAFSGRTLGGVPGSSIEKAQFYMFNNSANTGPETALFVNHLEVSCISSIECAISQVEGSTPATPDSQNIYNGPADAESYTWYLENNNTDAYIEGPDNQQSVVVNNGSGNGTYDLALLLTANSCEAFCSVTVEVGSTPAPEAGNNSPLCEGEDLILTASEIENATYTWVGPDFFLSTDQNPIIVDATTAADGEYSVSASVNGSPSPISSTYVTIYPAPECLINGTDHICPGTEQVVYYAPNDLAAYNWEIEGNAAFVNSPDNGVIRIAPEESGSFTLTLTILDFHGCSSVCVKTVTIGDDEGPVLECPPDASLSTGEDYSPEALGAATATDNCDGAPVVTYEDEILPGDCEGSSVITRTWTATDRYGNSSSCQQHIDIGDSEGPLLEVPGDAYLDCGSDTSPEALGYPNVSDNFDPAPVVSYVDEVYTIDCVNQYVIQRLWVAEDSCGNISENFQVIIVDDFGRPTMIVPPDVTVTPNDDISPEALGYATATDTCDNEPVISYFDETVEGNCASQYTVQRFWTAQDSCGNTTEAMQTIQVGSSEIAIVTPADAVVQCDGDASPEALGFATATDGLGQEVSVSYEDEIVTADCAGRYIILRTWQAQDECGNTEDSTQTIVIDDLTAPTLELPADATVSCDGDSSPEALGFAGATDNCDGAPVVSYTDTIVAGGNPSESFIQRLWSAVDGCGNISEAVQTITIEDITAPELSIPADAAVSCGDDTTTAALGEATSTDNCDGAPVVSYQDSIVAGDCAGNYMIERNWSATDAAGNATEAVQVISVSDTTAPVLTVPIDTSVACGASTDPASTGTASASDDCSATVAVTYTDDVNGSTITRTWSATDECGNSVESVQTITASDDETAPVLTVPVDATVECGDDTSAESLGSATATDACDALPTVSHNDTTVAGDCAGSYTIERLWTAVDASGNKTESTQVITVKDTTAPVLTVPAAVSVACGQSTDPSTTGTATASDNCSVTVAVTYTDNVNGSTITRTWSATDECGNSASSIQTITASDDVTAPVLKVPANATVECGGNTSPASLGTATATDTCDASPVVSYTDTVVAGDCAGRYTIKRLWKAVDARGNKTEKTQTITVKDTTAPVLTVPAAISICGQSADPSRTGMATASDNCSATVAVTYADVVKGTTITRTWTATDECGNSVKSTQKITTSKDTTAPVLTVPANVTVECGGDTSPASIGAAKATDTCDTLPVVSYTDTVTAGDCVGRYTIKRLWKAVDASGNKTEKTQTITVKDTTAPELIVPGDVTLGCGESTNPSNTGTAIASDHCSGATITYTDVTSGKKIIRTWTAKDGCGNKVSLSQNITTSGGSSKPPVIHSECILLTSVFPGQPVYYTVPTATSDCGPAPTVVCTPPPGSILDPGVYTIKCVATASSGLSSTSKISLVVLESLRVVVDSSLKDDNKADNIETDADVINEFKAGSTVPFKVKLYDARNNDVTAIAGFLVDVDLDMTLRQYNVPTVSTLLQDLTESYSGVGGSKGSMDFKGSSFQYNLMTSGYPTGTVADGKFIRGHIVVKSKLFPDLIVGEEDVLLESKK